MATTDPRTRLEALKIYTGMSLKRLAEEAGIRSTQTLYEIKKGRHNFSADVAARIQGRWPELSRGWIMSGEGDMLLSDGAPYAHDSAANDQRVPLLPVSAFAGPISSFLNDGVLSSECESVLSPSPGAELAVPVSGDSMEPLFHDGTVIFIKRINDTSFIPWGHTMVIDTENGAFVKDIFPGTTADSVIARSRNPRYPDMSIPKSSIFGLYRVLNAVRSFAVM